MTNWHSIRQTLPDNVRLVAVSKYHSIEQIAEAYAEGCRDFGESRVQELQIKQAALPKDIRWHFIGHLQTNKVRSLLKLRPYLIHSVDSEHLLAAINAEAVKQDIVQDILLELHVAAEETKSGFSIAELELLIRTLNEKKITNVNICGLMGMATNTDNKQEIHRCFHELHEQFLLLKHLLPMVNSQLSMGMSDDYRIAVSEGSTMVRIGSAIFGEKL